MSGHSTRTRAKNDPFVMLMILVGFSLWVLLLLLLPDKPVLIATAVIVGGALGVYVLYLATLVLLIPVNVLIRLGQRHTDQYTWAGLYLPFVSQTEIGPNHIRSAWQAASLDATTLQPVRGWRHGWIAGRKIPTFECEDNAGRRVLAVANDGGYFLKQATGFFHRASMAPIHGEEQTGWHRSYRFDHDWQIAEDSGDWTRSYFADGTHFARLSCGACPATMAYAWRDGASDLSLYPVDDIRQLSNNALRGLFVVRMSRYPCPAIAHLRAGE